MMVLLLLAKGVSPKSVVQPLLIGLIHNSDIQEFPYKFEWIRDFGISIAMARAPEKNKWMNQPQTNDQI